ncbi:MAG: DUF2219 family protein [Proteobacteria bacterium]|nr:DUF2219 family protein [Pseudomonadota bacterium]
MRLYYALPLLFCVQTAHAEDAPLLPPSVTKTSNQFLTLNVENDLFGNGTDRNYTSGVSLTYFDMGLEPSPLTRWLSKAIPTFNINPTTSVYYTIGQNLYTPDDIRIATYVPGQRPWAAFLYGSAGLATATANHIDEMEATIGVVGPLALGEETQRFIHSNVGSPDPKGWDNQLKNEPGLILSYQRRWPEEWSFDSNGLQLSVMPHAGATVGNVYTYGNIGGTIRLAPDDARFQDTPTRVRPAMPGTGFFHLKEGQFGWYLFAGVDQRLMLRNIFLDGNTFTDSHSVDKKYFVTDVSGGLALTYGKTRISYTLNWRSKEFNGQKDPSVFGSIGLGYRF